MNAKAIEVSFKRIYSEIYIIREKLEQKGGFWIFKVHVYSKEDLLKSDHFSKIYAITEKIGDDVENWHEAGKLNNRDLDDYYQRRIIFQDDLDNISIEIQRRIPTGFERFLGILEEFANAVMLNLPVFRRLLPEPIAKILWFLPSGGAIKLLPGGDKS